MNGAIGSLQFIQLTPAEPIITQLSLITNSMSSEVKIIFNGSNKTFQKRSQ